MARIDFMRPIELGFKPLKRLAPEKILALSFGVFILATTLVLMMPQSTKSGSIGFIDALFTAVSATCVTGLTVVDTGTYFTQFGQGVILLAIQLGGIGIMTFSTFLLYVFGRRLTSSDSALLSTSLGSTNGTTARGLLFTVVIISVIIEAIGATLLFSRFEPDMATNDAIWYSVFHSISAFCNAGFGLRADSLSAYAGNPTVNFTVMVLIMLGGIGFVAFLELERYVISRSRLLLERLGILRNTNYWSEAPFRFSIHSKIVIVISLSLVLIGAVLIGFLEFNNVQDGMPWMTRIISSLFQSVTPRTAGFNTLDIGAMSGATLFVIMILMFIGASPGSTGGGIKTSTLAVLLGMVRARLKRENSVVYFGRRIGTFVQSEAVTFTIIASAVVIAGAFLLQIFETGGQGHRTSGGKFVELLFEAISAFATVGLSTGITPKLAPLSKVVLIVLMFVGRVGPLTMALAISRYRQPSKVAYPEGRVIIG